MLELDHLCRRYGATVALDAMSFDVRPGEVVGFLGPNGAGKTTAMRAVLGIAQLDHGEVRWEGHPLDAARRATFGYMPEERGLYPTMSVLRHLTYLAQLHGLPAGRALTTAREWIETMGLTDRADDRIDALSLGNQQRVQLAAALVHDPVALILDEPFSGLDPVGIESLAEVLRRRAAEGVAVMFSSHQLDLVEGLCERVVIVDRGRNVLEGRVQELTTSRDVLQVRVAEDPDGQWAQDLAGTSITGAGGGRVRLRIEHGADPGTVLDAARAAGTVEHFSYDRKRLSEVFREAVGA